MSPAKTKYGQLINTSNDVFGNYMKSDATNPNLDKIKIIETESCYHYEFKIPGYIIEDFNFYINGNDDLVVTTEKSKSNEVTEAVDGRITKHSYCYASAYFKKRFQLPKNVVRNEISVEYKDEILSFDLFKSKN